MKKNNRHFIHQVNLEINTDNEQKAFDLNADVNKFLNENLVPNLEVLFDESVTEDQTKRINSIDIELGMKTTDQLESMQDQIISQIQEKIREADAEFTVQDSQSKQVDNQSNAGEGQRTSQTDKASETPRLNLRNCSTIDQLSNQRDVFLFFLEFGQLPWYAKPSLLNESSLSETFHSSIQNKLFIQKLKHLFASNKNAMERFIQQFEDEMIESLIHGLSVENERIPKKLNLKISSHSQALKNLVYKLIIKCLVHYNYQISDEQYLQLYHEILNEPRSDKSYNKLTEQIQELIFMVNLNPLQFSTSERSNSQKMVTPDVDRQIASRKYSETGTNMMGTKNSIKKSTQKLENDEETLKPGMFDEEIISEKKARYDDDYQPGTNVYLKPIHVQDAGLIIAHPFLGDLFTRTNCTGENGMLLTDKMSRAVHVLHFLATHKEMEMEYNLTFEKFLCGIPLDSTLERKILLTDHEKNECNDLLRTVINFWPELKNTSPDGLRQMFMQRNGKLDLHKAPYKLYVERKAQDVLLDKLQWNLSIVKLPWLTELLFVEW